MGTNAHVYSSMSKIVQDHLHRSIGSLGKLALLQINWATKQLSWHAYCCHSAGSPVQLLYWLTSTTVVTVKSRAHAKSLEASCHLAFPSQDEDNAWYLAQRGLLILQLHPKSYPRRIS